MANPPEQPGKPAKSRGLREAQTEFSSASMELAAVFAAYGRRCAFTGVDLQLEAATYPHGAVVRLNGASNAPGDVIPACEDAIVAFERGHLALGARCEFLVAKDVIDPEFDERLRPIGRLELPSETTFHPNLDLVARHRQAFAGGKLAR